MRIRLTIPCVLVAGVLALARTSGADMVDQSQLNGSAVIADFSATDLAQSFTPTYTNVSGAAILLDGAAGAGNVTLFLYDHLPNQSGTLLASATDVGASPGSWAQVEFASPVSVTPGDTYYLVFTSTNSTSGVLGSTSNPYPGGEAFANPGYTAYPSFDYAFETFSDAAAPLPRAAWTGSALLAGVAAWTLARRRAAARIV